jgi:hypothetical protein
VPQPIAHTFTVDASGAIVNRKRLEWLTTDVVRQYRGGEVEIEVRPVKRTPSQNKYYWGVVLDCIVQAFHASGQQMTKEALHEAFKTRYLGTEVVEVFGQEIVRAKSTARLDKTDFFYYVESIREDEDVREMLAATGFYIPDPNDYQAEHGAFRGYTIAEPA